MVQSSHSRSARVGVTRGTYAPPPTARQGRLRDSPELAFRRADILREVELELTGYLVPLGATGSGRYDALSRLIATTPYEILTFIGRGTSARDYRRLRAALDRLQSTTVATTLRQPPSSPRGRSESPPSSRNTGRRMHRFSWINEWTERADAFGNPDGIELIVPDWFYKAVLDEALVLTIDRAYFDLTGGIERWLYRIVRKHGGRQKRGWRFDFRHLYVKSGSLSPFKRFAFELRAIIQRQPLPGYTLFLEIEAGGRTLLAFEPAPCGQAVEAVVLSGTRTIVPLGTDPSCYREPKPHLTSYGESKNRPLNLESNKESNFCRDGHSGENRSQLGRKEEERRRQTAFSERDDDAVSKSGPARTGAGDAS